MKSSKLAAEQIAFILRHSEEDSAIGEIFRETGISDSMYGSLMPSEAKRLHQLEEENSKLKKIVADLLQYMKMLQDTRKALKTGCATGRLLRSPD